MSRKELLTKLKSKIKVYLFLIGVLLILLSVSNVNFALPSIIMFLLIVLYAIWSSDREKNDLEKHIQEVNIDVNKNATNALINSPFPIVIVKNVSDIIWKNHKFSETFGSVPVANYITELVKETKYNYIHQGINKHEREFDIEGVEYNVITHISKEIKQNNKEEYMSTIYFVDNSEYKKLLNEYQNKNLCIGIIMIDNYEEVLQRISAEEKPSVMAEIEKAIYDWTAATGGLVIKSERETFVFIFEQQYVENLEDNKFSILDTIRDIKISGKIQLTLSISIVSDGDSNYEKYKSAAAGMDIALGRGGDQAIIKIDNQYKFFGGKSQEVEKRTKVKARIIAKSLVELMENAGNVVVMGHKNGDIDSLGSSLGIYRMAKTLGKDAYIVNSSYGLNLENLITELEKEDEYKEIIIDEDYALDITDSSTLLVVVDTHKPSITEVPELLNKTKNIVMIDHHRKATEFIENPILSFHEVYASSAAELVVEILQYSDIDIELKDIEAESLYAGIMIDTKNFIFKTGVRTFEAAAFLRKYGIDIIRIKKWFQSDLKNYNLIADIVKNAEVIRENIGISVYEKKSKDATYICAKAADELLYISNITASFVIGNLGDKICISGRSVGDINVQLILEQMGGGGHITTAGAQLENSTIEEVKQELLEKINEYFEGE